MAPFMLPEELLAALLEKSLDGVVMMDSEGLVREFNPAACRMFGYELKEVLGQPMAELIIPPSLRKKHLQAFRGHLDGAPPRVLGQRIEMPALHKDGHEFPVELSLARMEVNGGPLFAGFFRDLSEERKAREALASSERYYHTLIDNALDIVTIIGPDGAFRFESPSLTAVLGWKPEDLVGKDAFSFLHPEDLDYSRELFRQALEDPGQAVSAHVRFRHKDGSWRQLVAKAKSLEGVLEGGGVLVNSRDITEELRAEQLMHTYQRLAFFGQMAAGLAHEVRNPLAAIQGAAQLARMKLDDGSPLAVELDVVLNQAGRLSRLMCDILEHARAPKQSRKPCMAQDLLENALAMALTQFGPAGQKAAVEKRFENGLPALRVDEERVERLLLNLVMNALQACAAQPAPRLLLAAVSKGKGVDLMVQDNGKGIPPDALPRVFDPFFSTRAQGSGLGLWIAKSIAEEHQGALEAENNADGGACFRLWLPAAGGA